jgi:tetratricopeptide (TPR) repeat protein
VVAALILAGGIAAYMLLGSKRVVVLPSVATAEVAGDGRIFSVPLDSADVVATVRKGDKVNVIRAPRSRAQEWVEVQYVSGANVFSAGAMRTVNLTNWESTKPDVELSLLQIFGPGEGATETELRAQIARYSDFVTRIAGSAQEARARLDMARLNIQLARLEAAAGRPNGPEITAAARDLGAIQNNAELAGAVQHLRTELQTLEAAAPHSPSSPSPAAPPPLNAAAATKRAEGYWEDGEYDQAERLLRRVLREQPGYDAARVLLDKVQRAKQLEGRE